MSLGQFKCKQFIFLWLVICKHLFKLEINAVEVSFLPLIRPVYDEKNKETVHNLNDSVNWFFKSHTIAFLWRFPSFYPALYLSLSRSSSLSPHFISFSLPPILSCSLFISPFLTQYCALNVIISLNIKLSWANDWPQSIRCCIATKWIHSYKKARSLRLQNDPIL